MIELQYEDNFAKIYLEEGIVYGIFKHPDVDLEMAIQIVKNRKEICNGEVRPMQIDLTQVKKLSKEARDYLGTEEGSELLAAAAIITDSPLSSLLANFFMKINIVKTVIPLKMFATIPFDTENINSLYLYRRLN